MKSIAKTQYNKHVINKSVFHNYLIPVKHLDDMTRQLDDIKDTHQGANHYCIAYIIGEHKNIQKYEDDGEPSGTAGLPMLDVLKKNDLTNVCAVSVRFFGGIKLGASGLIRAYAKGVSLNIDTATFTTLQTILTVTLTIPFDEIGHVEHFVRKEYDLIDTTYTKDVMYTIRINNKQFDTFQSFFINNTSGKAVIDIIDKTRNFQ